MLPKKQAYQNLANTLIKKLKTRNMEGYYAQDKEEALSIVQNLLSPGCSVSWGGSESIKEIGVIDMVQASNYIIYDRTTAKTVEEQTEIYSKMVTADYFFMSSNAITLNGELVNIDGNGNRVACLIYGPKNVIIVAGMNKIVPDIQSAVARIRNFASPANASRLNTNTPCGKNGCCGDCLADDCMCCQIVITRKSRQTNRIKVILVGEELGF